MFKRIFICTVVMVSFVLGFNSSIVFAYDLATDPYAVAINKNREKQEKRNLQLPDNARTEYTKFSDFISYLRSINQYDESLAYRPAISPDEPGTYADGTVATNYYKSYYFNEFLQNGMPFIQYSNSENPPQGYTVVASSYDLTKKKVLIELKRGDDIFVNQAALREKLGVDILNFGISGDYLGRDYFSLTIHYNDPVTGHKMLKEWQTSDLSMLTKVGIAQYEDKLINIKKVEAFMKTTPSDVTDITKFQNSDGPKGA